MKIFLAIVMLVLGVLGLLCTTCGVLFLHEEYGVGWIAVLVGILPGLLFLLGARLAWGAMRSRMKASSEAAPPGR